jgi:hypothetical protein
MAGRVLILDDDAKTHDVLDVVEVTDLLIRARTPYLFEIGEELRLRIESTGKDVTARVRAHDPERVTELEILR